MQDKPIQRFYYFVYYVDNYQRYVVADHAPRNKQSSKTVE